MEHPSAGIVDLASTLEHALETAASNLSRTARELGAGEAFILISGAKAEITHHWRHSTAQATPDVAPNSGVTRPSSRDPAAVTWACSLKDGFDSGDAGSRASLSESRQDCLKVVGGATGPVVAATPVAHILREALPGDSHSFLLVPWPVRQRALTVVFGFSAIVPPHRSVPDSAAANLNLVSLAAWSLREIMRLRTELKTVNGRLAGRKAVERAKGMLQAQQGLTEEGAYEYMRGLSRQRRITLARLAEEVLQGRGSGKVKPPLRTVA